MTREEQAKIEIGRTDISRGLALFLTAVFLLTIYALPLGQHVRETLQYRAGLRETAVPQCYDIVRGFSQAMRISANTDGNLFRRIMKGDRELLREMSRYEDTLAESSWLTETLLSPVQYVMSRRLGVGNESVYLGREGWLYYRPDVDYLMGPGFLDSFQLRRRELSGEEWEEAPQPDPVKAIVRFHEQLASRDIALVVMPVPLKPMIHAERMARPAKNIPVILQNRSYMKFLELLNASGVDVFDASKALADAYRRTGEAQYLATDTHWTPNAMVLVAEALAEHVEKRVELPEPGAPRYIRGGEIVTNLGDIALMLKLPEGQQFMKLEAVRILPVMGPDHSAWRPSKSADVLVLGDSFSNIYSLPGMQWGSSAGLVEQLSFCLQRPCDRIVRNDDGAFATRLILSRELAAGRDRLAGKRVVVWQFAMRELAQGDWKLLPMRVERTGRAQFLLPEQDSELTE